MGSNFLNKSRKYVQREIRSNVETHRCPKIFQRPKKLAAFLYGFFMQKKKAKYIRDFWGLCVPRIKIN